MARSARAVVCPRTYYALRVGWSVHTLSERHHFSSLAGGDHDGVVTLGLARGRKFLGALFGGEKGSDLTLLQRRLARIFLTLKTQYDLNGATLQLLLASSFLGMFIGAAALGRLADRIGRRRAFLFNLIGFSLWTKAWTPRDTALSDDGRMPILVEPTIVADVWSSTDQPSIPADPQTVMRTLSKSDAAAVAESVP